MSSVAPDRFYLKMSEDARTAKDLLWPLSVLPPRERAVFTEYYYWNTHMKVIATSHKISLGRAYELLYRAEERLAATRAQEKKTGADSL
ncbi:MAG: hypothetical protein HY891_05520 [Deltaproteobacteria bacterium]|nr:hypothetical protein [Deltaproteobacteria bacterium]